MTTLRRLLVIFLLVTTFHSLQAQRVTTLNNETNNNTTGCTTQNSSHVGVTSCQASFSGASDDSSAGTDNNNSPNSPIFNQTVNTVTFDAAPGNVADFTFDGVDIHNLIYAGYSGKVFANVLLWHKGGAGSAFTFHAKEPNPPGLSLDIDGGHFLVGYTSDDTNQVAAQLAFMQRMNIDGIVGNPPGPLPPGVTGQGTKNAQVNDAMMKWRLASDNASSPFLFSVMTDQAMWDGNSQCNGNLTIAHQNFDPVCVEKLMICSLDYMNTATTSSFACPLDGLNYTGSGLFADSKYWKVSGHPVISYFVDEAAYFGGKCTSASPCTVYNDNQAGIACTTSQDCWAKLFIGVGHHINNFLTLPYIIHRDTFSHAAPNNGSFRWFNPSTAQSYQNFGADPNTPSVDTRGYDGWLNDGTSNSALNTTLPVALAVAYGKVDHSQSPFADQSGPPLGSQADHRIMDAQCGKTWLAALGRPSAKGFGTSHQLQALEIATFDDYDEGTEMETGIDNCVSSLAASLSGQTLSWSIAFSSPGDESTIDHYAVFYSTDGTLGQNLTLLQNVPVNSANNRSYSLNLGTGLPSTAVIYVKAVGKSMLRNHIADAGVCTSCGSGDFSLSLTVDLSRSAEPYAQYNATLTPLNGFTGTLNCTVSGLPTGGNAICPPATITNGAVTVQLHYGSSLGGITVVRGDVQITYTAASGTAHSGAAPSSFPNGNGGVDSD
jgi:hypothetical protein